MSRKRIVINLDAPPDGTATAATRPMSRSGKKRRWPKVLGILLTLFLIAIVPAFFAISFARAKHLPPERTVRKRTEAPAGTGEEV